MEKDNIKEFIDKLKNLENQLSGIEPTDSEIPKDIHHIQEIQSLLTLLDGEIKNDFQKEFNNVNIKIKKLNPNAVIPTYSKDGDAGMDLTITEILSNTTFDVTYSFGIAIEMPKGYVGLIFPRSSIRKLELTLVNSVGVIDSGYRGEIQGTFKKTNGLDSFKYNVGDRGAQIIILPYPQIKFEEVSELTETERGEGGFGSTGS